MIPRYTFGSPPYPLSIGEEVVPGGAMRLGYPPPLYLLVLVRELGRVRRRDVHEAVYRLKLRGVDLGYEFSRSLRGFYSRELDMDLAMLKALGLLREGPDGTLELTEKGLRVMEGFSGSGDPVARRMAELFRGAGDLSPALRGRR